MNEFEHCYLKQDKHHNISPALQGYFSSCECSYGALGESGVETRPFSGNCGFFMCFVQTARHNFFSRALENLLLWDCTFVSRNPPNPRLPRLRKYSTSKGRPPTGS